MGKAPQKFSHLPQRREFSVTTETLETLGDSITSAVLVSWSKEPGDSVQEDDVIAIVETDKVTMDIKAKKNGVFIEGEASVSFSASKSLLFLSPTGSRTCSMCIRTFSIFLSRPYE